MTWQEFAAARQVLVEEFLGTHLRARVLAEDAQVDASKKAIRETQGI